MNIELIKAQHNLRDRRHQFFGEVAICTVGISFGCAIGAMIFGWAAVVGGLLLGPIISEWFKGHTMKTETVRSLERAIISQSDHIIRVSCYGYELEHQNAVLDQKQLISCLEAAKAKSVFMYSSLVKTFLEYMEARREVASVGANQS